MRRYDHGGDIYGPEPVLLDFSVNVNPLGLPATARQALIRHLPDYERYPDPACRQLTQALARQHQLKPEQVLCGNGAADLLFRLAACLKPRRALTLAPAFSEYERSTALFGGEIREHRLLRENGFALTRAVLDELTPDLDMLFLCNPNNPTARLIEPGLLEEIAAACQQLGVYLVLDECFIDFTHGQTLIPRLGAYPRLLILRAFTKIYALAGLRLGYLLAADAGLLAKIAAFGPKWNVSVAAQIAGLACLEAPGWLEKSRELIDQERAFLARGLTELGLRVFPSDANFLLIQSDRPLLEPLKAQGILLRDCANFSGLDHSYLRIGLKTHEDNQALLSLIAEALHD